MMMHARSWVVMALFLGCRGGAERASVVADTAVAEPAPAIVIGRLPEGWGGDVEVPAKILRANEHSFNLRARGTIDGKLVEIEVSFDEAKPGAGSSVEVRPLVGGDAFLAGVARAWKQKAPSKMRTVRVAAAWLAGSAAAARESAVHTKVFFEEQDAELFVNWNPQTSMLELSEKDDEYRSGVLRALGEP